MRRLIIGLILAVTMMSGSSQTAEAQLIPNMYNFVFGGPYYRTAYYGPSYGYGGYYSGFRGYGSYYRGTPVVSYYAPSYSPCNTCCSPCNSCCSPCGNGCTSCSSGGCAGGNCSVDSTPATEPREDDDWRATPGQGEGPSPRTFRDDERGMPPAEPADPGFGPEEGRQPPGGGGFGDEPATERESLKPAETIEQREGAPIKEPEAGSAPEKKAEPGGNEELFFPSLDVDEKVTWRPVPSRKRLTIRSRFPTPSIARTRISPNDRWVPVSVETKIVSK